MRAIVLEVNAAVIGTLAPRALCPRYVRIQNGQAAFQETFAPLEVVVIIDQPNKNHREQRRDNVQVIQAEIPTEGETAARRQECQCSGGYDLFFALVQSFLFRQVNFAFVIVKLSVQNFLPLPYEFTACFPMRQCAVENPRQIFPAPQCKIYYTCHAFPIRRYDFESARQVVRSAVEKLSNPSAENR